ncbi:MAG: hypothetical protein ACI9PY_002689 [Ascidiaceihabitans sp.]|jgi:hypothetical protein
MMNLTRLLAVASLGLITACSGGTETATGQSQAISEAVKASNIGKRKNAPAQMPVLTRALLNTITVSSLEATIENTGSTAFMIPLAARTDSSPGKVMVWKTVGTEQVILRNGVLVGTKGVGNDLGSANAHSTVRGLKSRGNTGGQKTLYVRRDDNSTEQIRLQCEMTNLGRESIVIVERSYPTTHMREVCSNATGAITNDFWIEGNDITVRKSRQWGGPNMGYISFRLLKK